MDLNRKKELLLLVDSIGKDVNADNCGNYVPKIINAIEIGKKYNDKNKFKIALENMKNTSFGGKAQKIGYRNFVDNIITKKEYNIDSLDFEELEFVFSWLRRIVKTKSENNKINNYDSNKNNNYSDNRKNNYNRNLRDNETNRKSVATNKANINKPYNNTKEDLDNPFSALKNIKF